MSTPTQTTQTRRAQGRRPQYDGPTAEEKLVASLVALLEAGVNPWRRDWSVNGAHRNLLTGHAYRGANPALLEMYASAKGAVLPLWVGIAQAKSEGWYPRKGSTGAYVLRPQLNRRELTGEDGAPLLTPEGAPSVASWVSYKPACVFNVCDLVGATPDDQLKLDACIAAARGLTGAGTEPERLDNAERALGAWSVPTTWAGDRAFYSPGADAITMPTREQFTSAGALYATWAHEMAHSTGHASRLKRDLSGTMGTTNYAREELVAELAAFLVCNRLQIPSDSQNHAAYLGSWAKVLREGPKVLFKVLSDATKACNLILGPDVTGEDAN